MDATEIELREMQRPNNRRIISATASAPDRFTSHVSLIIHAIKITAQLSNNQAGTFTNL